MRDGLSSADKRTDRALAAILLAAGRGTRMRSRRAKVLHQLGGEPMAARPLSALSALGADPLVMVVGHQAAEVETAAREAASRAGIRSELIFALQKQQRGTGDAARRGVAMLPEGFAGDILFSYGDVPLVRAATLAAFLRRHREHRAALSFISAEPADFASYGRVIRDAAGAVEKIVEARDATPAEQAVREINTGIYLADAAFMRSALEQLRPGNAQREYYLTDVVEIARRRGLKTFAWRAPDAGEFSGINSLEDLAQMESQIRAEVNRRLMAAGVTIADPATAYIGEQAQIGADTLIGPNVQIIGRCRIGSGVIIEGTAWLKDVTIGDRCHIKLGVRAEDCAIGADSEIGPFANLRAGTELEGHNRIGNFVETKKARIGSGTKASHLAYLGDATIGRDTNVGCGVITVNYDGYVKHPTVIGDRCMIGCDTQLVAPIKVGNDVYVASGTTIVREVPDGALAVSDHPQREKPGWVAKWRRRHGE